MKISTLRSTVALFAAALFLGSFALIADGKSRAAGSRQPTENNSAIGVLMIGDSLSAGPFGEALQRHLAMKFGPQNIAAFASCGSSPENWLEEEPVFFTKCGYRESTPDRPPIFRDFHNGKPPRPTLTPKVETLVRRYNPTVVLVQLGTNWMDRNLSDAQMGWTIHRFVDALRGGGSVRQIVWIEPPDSSAFRKTQGRVHRVIESAAVRHRFEVIDSRPLTHYVSGKTGGDGIHYNSEASRAWAAKLSPLLDAKLGRQLANTR